MQSGQLSFLSWLFSDVMMKFASVASESQSLSCFVWCQMAIRETAHLHGLVTVCLLEFLKLLGLMGLGVYDVANASSWLSPLAWPSCWGRNVVCVPPAFL